MYSTCRNSTVLSTASPSKLTITSPGSIPAPAAGLLFSTRETRIPVFTSAGKFKSSARCAPEINDEYWTVTYKIGFDFIKKYYPEFDIEKASYVKGNVYKCGDETPIEHYMSYFEVKCENPDFHRPEYFGKIEIQ